MSGISPTGGPSGSGHQPIGPRRAADPQSSEPPKDTRETEQAAASTTDALTISVQGQVLLLLREDPHLADVLAPKGLPEDELQWGKLYDRMTNPVLLAEIAAIHPLLHAILVEEEEKRKRRR